VRPEQPIKPWSLQEIPSITLIWLADDHCQHGCRSWGQSRAFPFGWGNPGLVESDGRSIDFRRMDPDPDAVYEKTVMINAKDLKPTIACPHQVDNIKTIDEIGEVKVDQVYLGTSCNGRLEDFQVAAKILKDKKIHPKIRLIITPGSDKFI